MANQMMGMPGMGMSQGMSPAMGAMGMGTMPGMNMPMMNGMGSSVFHSCKPCAWPVRGMAMMANPMTRGQSVSCSQPGRGIHFHCCQYDFCCRVVALCQ